MTTPELESLLAEFRSALGACRRLYREAGRVAMRSYPDLAEWKSTDFMQYMDDLHRGLLIKIYVTVAVADRRWSRAELRFAQALFEHLWLKRLVGEPLRAAVRGMFEENDGLRWNDLFHPFVGLSELRSYVGELETVVMRVANLVAKADGEVTPVTRQHLVSIQIEFDRQFRPIPLDEGRPKPKPAAAGRVAAETLKAEADAIRPPGGATRETPPSPTAEAGEDLLEQAIGELDRLVGLVDVKGEIRTLVNFLKVQQKREAAGLPTVAMSHHLVLCGNPGTGKTTVARILGKIYNAMGILSKGHLVETDRSGLVAEYAGQTAIKTNTVIDQALDGILFIDEAYSLALEEGEDQYGAEAIQALLRRMENDRERLIVAIAGYPDPIERMINRNPGLASRFQHKFMLPDYSASELGQIFQLMGDANRYDLPAAARAKLLRGFQWLLDRRDERFGNGRLVRNTFERSIRRLADRIISIAPLTVELLTTLEAEDIDMSEVPDDAWDRLAAAIPRFRVRCPACRNESSVPDEYLNQHVKCNRCGHRFVAGWGDPVGEE